MEFLVERQEPISPAEQKCFQSMKSRQHEVSFNTTLNYKVPFCLWLLIDLVKTWSNISTSYFFVNLS